VLIGTAFQVAAFTVCKERNYKNILSALVLLPQFCGTGFSCGHISTEVTQINKYISRKGAKKIQRNTYAFAALREMAE
jgi:hypothetical protein